MAWIRTTNGDLINMDHVAQIVIYSEPKAGKLPKEGDYRHALAASVNGLGQIKILTGFYQDREVLVKAGHYIKNEIILGSRIIHLECYDGSVQKDNRQSQ